MRFDGNEHPPELTLSRFVDGVLAPDAHNDLVAHLEVCGHCRGIVEFFVELGRAARALEFRGNVMPDVADAVIRRRRAGERVDLSGASNGAGARPRRRLSGTIAAGLLLTLTGSAYLLLAPTAAATRGNVTFGSLPADPNSGLPVTYSPAYYLAAEDSLRLRVRVTTDTDASAHGTRGGELRVATLHRGSDGVFRGRLLTEDGDLLAVAAIEDFGAAMLDSNLGALWSTYIGDGDRPSLATLESHYRSLESYNPILAAEFARRLTVEDPDRPLGWALSVGAAPAPEHDSALTFHRVRLRDQVARARGTTDPSELHWLSLYAGRLGELAVRDSLVDELERLQPQHVAVQNRRVLEATREAAFGSRELVSQLERLWFASGRPSELLVHMGVQAAAAADLRDAVQSWIERARRHPAVDPRDVARAIEPYPRLADLRASLLRDRLGELEADDDLSRPLRASRTEYEAHRRAEIMDLRLEFAEALSASGDGAAATDLYRVTAKHGWRPKEIRPFVDLLLARGDTVAALPAIGLLVADPLLGQTLRNEFEGVIERRVEDIEAFAAEARAELTHRALTSVPRASKIRGDTRLKMSSGRETTARDFLSGHPAVLLLWDARFGSESDWLTSFVELAGRTRNAVPAAIVVSQPVEEPPSTGSVPFIVDDDRELAAQVRDFALPALVVLDPDLGAMTTLSDVADAFRLATILTW